MFSVFLVNGLCIFHGLPSFFSSLVALSCILLYLVVSFSCKHDLSRLVIYMLYTCYNCTFNLKHNKMYVFMQMYIFILGVKLLNWKDLSCKTLKIVFFPGLNQGTKIFSKPKYLASFVT